MLKHTLLICMLICLTGVRAGIDKSHFFNVFGSNAADKMKTERIRLEKMNQTSEVRAYLGALIMREAAYMPSAKEKLAHFNRGKAMLESEIASHRTTVEYRLLRLMIQENCPRILNYYGQKSEDADLVAKEYMRQSDEVKAIILSYSKKSKLLPTSKLTS